MTTVQPARMPIRYRQPILRDAPAGGTPIGVVVPFDFELDWEYWRYIPPGVSLHITRTPRVDQPVGMRLAREVGKPSVVHRSSRALAALNPAVHLYACSSGSFVNGLEGEAAIRAAMLRAGARDAVTTSGAMLEAFSAAGLRRVAIATPYSERLTVSLVDFIEAAGYEVPAAHYLGMSGDISTVSQHTIADLVREAAHPSADAVFLSCTALRTHGIIAELEREIGVPVFTSNQVSFWAALGHAGALHPALHTGDGWVLGGGSPMAASTALLLASGGSVADEALPGAAG